MSPAAEKDECPEGQARNPSSIISLEGCVQIRWETMAALSGVEGKLVRTYLEKLARSG